MADNLLFYMNKNGISRNDLCRDLDFKYTTVTGWVTAEKYPRIDKIEMMANYFGINKSDLVEERAVNFTDSTTTSIRIPVYGTIPAGIPLEAIEDILDTEEIPVAWGRGGKEYFALRVKGDSMEPEYLDKDTVIFLKTPVCENKDDCCVMVNGNDATFKRVFLRDDGVTLQPLNANFEAKFYSNEQIETLPVEILGVAKELRRVK